MSRSAISIANTFLDIADRKGQHLTNMQLQKLVYIAHGFHLALKDEPLFYNNVHAWRWGPVVPKLYKSLSKYGAGRVTDRIPTDDDDDIEIDNRAQVSIRAVWEAYGQYSGPDLSAITHKADSPWSQTWRTKQYGIIPNELIRDYYRRLLHERSNTTHR